MDIKSYWERKHSRYEKADWIDTPSIFAEFALEYFPKKGTVLDLGAGQGQDSRFFASLGYDVLSTDFSDYALSLSKKKTKNLENIKWQNIDMSKGVLPFSDSSFDVVYANLSLHYFDSEITEKLFSEIRRVLKNNGIVAMLLNSIKDPEVKTLKSIGDGLYEDERGLEKRYFSVDYLKDKAAGKFNITLLDYNGARYDNERTQESLRFIGKKL
ncbi:MAG: class I SAM-dependent methyltransferase [Patescibacteria group bacterium]|nr:class I SAM-dependent methyltransferase [Patescibacteria group bacterium]